MPAFEHPAQRLARAQQMRLADVFVERRRPHAIRQRPRIRRRGVRFAHHRFAQASTRWPSRRANERQHQSADDADAVGVDIPQVRLAAEMHRALQTSIRMPMTSSATPMIG